VANAVLASVDGRIGPPAEATISILDEGLLRGDGAFEVIKLYGGHPFRLAAHVDRLGRSAAAIELEFERTALEAEIEALLESGEAPEGCLRLVVTRGGRRVLTLEELPPFAESVAVALVELSPSEILSGVKSLSYAANMQATRIAARRGAGEAVYVRPDGIVLEAPTSTIFWAREGALRTPSIEAGILASITRDRLVRELDVAEGEYPLEDLMAAEEAFLASTVREVQPVSAIDGTELPAVAGPLTEGALAAFKSVLDRELASPPSTSSKG